MIRVEKKSEVSTYNPALDKYDNIVLFKEKVERAKRTLAKVGIPEKWKNELANK
jgi:hypothetical protein